MQLIKLQRKHSLISLTPLIDVVFILLIFFMLASSFAEWQFIELSVGEIEEIRADSLRTSRIKLVSNDTFLLNDKEMGIEEIVSIVRERCRGNINHPIIIQSHDGVSLQSLVTILDQINEFADKNVSLAKIDS